MTRTQDSEKPYLMITVASEDVTNPQALVDRMEDVVCVMGDHLEDLTALADSIVRPLRSTAFVEFHLVFPGEDSVIVQYQGGGGVRANILLLYATDTDTVFPLPTPHTADTFVTFSRFGHFDPNTPRDVMVNGLHRTLERLGKITPDRRWVYPIFSSCGNIDMPTYLASRLPHTIVQG